jgi:tetratricopeptide (TPR) repeat protein
MSRFRWLEIDESEGNSQARPRAPEGGDLDESQCLAKADQYLRKGECESALQWYSRALRFAIGLEEAWVGQVRCLLELDENVEANIWAERGLERFPDSPDLLAAKALALSRTRGFARAMEYSDAALQVKGRAVGHYPWLVRGELLLNGAGSRQGADRCFAKAIELGGSDWYTHYLIGMVLLRKGLYEEARRRLAAATGLERSNAVAWCALGDSHQRMGELGAATLAYRRALEADAHCKHAKAQLAELDRVGPVRRVLRWLRGKG